MGTDPTSQWLEKAKEDEKVVQLIVDAEGPWALAAYHLQQVAEKHVKALLVHLGIAPPRSHDLGFLLARIVGYEVAPEVFEAADEVSAYAWLTRYPGTPEISQEQIVTLQQRVSHITAFVKARLNS